MAVNAGAMWLVCQVLPGGFAGYEDGFGFATPGHAEEQDYMTAFFENQDHEAVSLYC